MYLAIDLGTTGCRSILFDGTLQPLAVAYREYPLITPREAYVEQDANLWWELTKETLQEATQKAGVSGKEIRSISISSQGITIVPVNEQIEPLCNALSWLDMRAEVQCQQLREDFGEEYIFSLTGKPINAAYSLPKLLWLKRHQPDIYKTAYKFLMPLDFLTAKFTGNCVTDHSMASGTLMYDLKNLCWSEKILSYYGIEEKQLPSLTWGGESAGAVLPQVAQELGLSEDCVVAVGAQDQKCAAYGVGLEDGVMTISLGTAAAVTKIWDTANTEQNKGVGWCGYVEPGKFVTEGVISTAGTCLRWVRDMLFPGEAYDIMNAEAQQAREKGSGLLFYPYMSEEANFYGVNLAAKRGDFALAVMEGVAFQTRVLLEIMEAHDGIHTLVLFGGGANSPLWCQIIADITNKRICVPQTSEAAAAGAARLAANAVGTPLAPLSCAHTYLPSQLVAAYEDKYAKYRQIEKKLWAQEAAV